MRWSGSTEKALRQQRLHISSAVSDEHDNHTRAENPIDHSIRLERHLAKLANPKREEFAWMRTPVRELSQTGGHVQNPFEHPIRRASAVGLQNDTVISRKSWLHVGNRRRRAFPAEQQEEAEY